MGTPEVETPEEAAAREEAVEKSAYSPQEEAYRRSRMAAQRDVEKDTVRTVAQEDKHNAADTILVTVTKILDPLGKTSPDKDVGCRMEDFTPL